MKSQITIEEIYENYVDDVYRYNLFLVREKELAEDLTQETFIKVHINLHKFAQQASLRTWILKIARNTVYDHFKRKKRIHFIPTEIHLATSIDRLTPEIHYLKKDLVIQLYRALGDLKKDYQEVLILRKINELSIQETAEVLGWTENKVKAKTARALGKLKEKMQQEEEISHESTK